MEITFFYFLVIAGTLSIMVVSVQKIYHDYILRENKKIDLEMKRIHEKSVSDYRERRDYR